MTTHLVWLRNDLRLQDNTALYEASRDPYARVLAVFIATPKQWQSHNMSYRQAEYIRQHLCCLSHDLADHGIMLYYKQCTDFIDQINWLISFCQREQVSKLFYNYQYEINERKRDLLLEQKISGNTKCYAFNDSVLLPPGSIYNNHHKMYRVYTSFRDAFVHCLKKNNPICLPAPQPRGRIDYSKISKIAPFDYSVKYSFKNLLIGEKAALSRLNTFCCRYVQYYHCRRNIPALDATSKLSAWLAIGVLSPRQCYSKLLQVFPEVLTSKNSSAFSWLNELIWRDFYRHLIVAWPSLCKHDPFIPWTRNIQWIYDDKLLDAWRTGHTGYPIVDAAMRQLLKTGWMHNRMRMISASFLVKDLLIDWRYGERYFMSQLVDGDLAANNGGWQWVASTGTDAAPYFRIFNPTIQGKRFDPNGVFIRYWLPELKNVPNNYIHEPHKWLEAKHSKMQYPLPIINHSTARLRALHVYRVAKAKNENTLIK